MNLIDMTCPHCKGTMKINSDDKSCVCEYCGATVLIDSGKTSLSFDNAEESGYLFERGRQRAIEEATREKTENQYTPPVAAAQPKKRKTWLWVLGWLFIFPVPLTILMLRNTKYPKAVRYAIIALAWIVFLAMAANNNSDSINNKNDNTAGNTSKESIVTYTDDDIVNKFITDFNLTSPFEIKDVSKGNLGNTYNTTVNDCYVEMISTNNASENSFYVSILGGQEEADKEKMFDVFSQTLKVLDPEISDDLVEKTVGYLSNEQSLVSDYKINEKLTVETYHTATDTQYGKSSCFIDVVSIN